MAQAGPVHATITVEFKDGTMQRLVKLSAGMVMCLSACGVGGGSDAITVEITFSGEGVDRARIVVDPKTPERAETSREPGDRVPPPPDPYVFEGDDEIVDLPWSTTITIDGSDGRSQDFDIIAINETETGTLSCEADFKQADGDGTWGRSNSFIAGCSGDVRFDGDEVTLDPGGRSTSVEARDDRRAEIAAAIEAEAQRVSDVEAAQAAALPSGSAVEIDGWRITPTGVNRDAAGVLVTHNQTNSFSSRERAVLIELAIERTGADPGRLSKLAAGLVGGFDLDVAAHDDARADCGVIPDSWHNLPGELASGDEVRMNVCRVVSEDNAPGGWLTLGVVRGDEFVEVLLPDSGVVGGRDVVSAADNNLEPVEVSKATLQVVGVSVDDIDDLTARNGGTVGPMPDDEAYVLVDVAVSHNEDYEVDPDLYVDWRLTSADGSRLYGFDTRDTKCRRVFGFLPPGPAEDVDEYDFFDLVFPGETKVVGACWAIPRDDLAGALLQFESSDGTKDVITFDLGL